MGPRRKGVIGEMGPRKDIPQGKGGHGEEMGPKKGWGLGRSVPGEKVGGKRMCPHKNGVGLQTFLKEKVG
jgi:hypothetical protein